MAHILGKMNTAAKFLLHSESDPIEKITLKNAEDVPTQPIEFNIESTGIAKEDQVFFHTEDVELPPEIKPWQHKQDKRNAVHTEPT